MHTDKKKKKKLKESLATMIQSLRQQHKQQPDNS
jgi:hypothetical protein